MANKKNRKPEKMTEPKLIVALDVSNLKLARSLLEELKGIVTFYKVGIKLFSSEGRKAVDLVHHYGGEVFLDLKINDIPQTVQDTVREAARMEVYSLSLHVSGGKTMLEMAASVSPRPRLWGVTVLTSLDHEDLQVLGIKKPLREIVLGLAHLGIAHGMDGIVCSGHEALMLRSRFKQRIHLIVAGVRPARMETHDQKRTITPGEAARLGADFIVVGRPIIHSPHPQSAAVRIVKEIKKRESARG